MSKISLKPNASGTANFTIESPATNTDRTFTLPDEAGTVVAETSGNEVYRKQNILGTVSQSGGVPTGAIIERGSNANGEYVKFADGTLFMKSKVNLDLTSTTPQAFSYPASYVGDRPATSVSGAAQTTEGRAAMSNVGTIASPTTYEIIVGTSEADASYPVSLMAIARWY